MPTSVHEVPAVLIKPRHSLGSQSVPHRAPQLLLVLASVVVGREVVTVAADVPEEDPEGVHIHGVVVLPTEHLRSHVNGRAHKGVAHHCAGLAKPKICQ